MTDHLRSGNPLVHLAVVDMYIRTVYATVGHIVADFAGAWAGPLAGFATWAATTCDALLRNIASWHLGQSWNLVETATSTTDGITTTTYQMSLPW